MANLISKINGIDICTVAKDGVVYVPIKPVCEAIGIAFEPQYSKIQSDDILGSVVTIIVTTGADGKQYEMVCIPLKFVYGWLFTINPGKVAPEARATVSRYRRECYEALYDHFERKIRAHVEENEAEIKLLEQLAEAVTIEKDARVRQKAIKSSLDKLRAERLNPQQTLF